MGPSHETALTLSVVGLGPQAGVSLQNAGDAFCEHAGTAHIRTEGVFVGRLLASLLAKRFLLLTGLSGSGKTKLAQALAVWMGESAGRGTGEGEFGVAAGRVEKGQTTEGGFFWKVEPYHAARDRIVFSKAFAGELFRMPEAGTPEDILILLDGKKPATARIRQTTRGAPQLYSLKEANEWLQGLGIGSYFRVRVIQPPTPPFRNAVSFERLDAPPCVEPRYALIAVGANWMSKEDLLGYPDALNAGSFRAKPALELLLRATEDPGRPYFLILDEMNLSHVERYFSDFLSAMESGEAITLHEGGDWQTDGETPVPAATSIPPNLFVIGTVNVDETTYMFSPKVLDRANVIEFRADAASVTGFLGSPAEVDLGRLAGKGAEFAELFVQTASSKLGADFNLDEATKQALQVELDLLFAVLAEHEAEFGFRTAKDVARFVHCHKLLSGDTWQFVQAMDAVVMQKILPKLHGSQAKLTPVLQGLGAVCYVDRAKGRDELLTAARAAASRRDETYDFVGVDAEDKPRYDAGKAHYPMSFAKIQRMLRKLERDGFASFAEA